MRTKTVTVILIICFVLTACRNNTLTITPASSSVEIEEMTSPATSAGAVSTLNVPTLETQVVESWEYEVVYQKEDFKIREAFLFEDWNWEDFSMPQSRIQNTVPDLGFYGGWCDTLAEYQASGWCTETVTITTASGQEYRFDLACDHMLGGHCTLTKNHNLLWEGELNGGTCRAIESSRRIGDEIALAYHSSNWDGENPSFWSLDSILLTKGNTVEDMVKTTGYTAAFAPNELQDRLIYFASEGGVTFLVFDGDEVGERYMDVFNQYCCWDGPPIQVYCDGKIVDFFAEKEDDWYHVQAGLFEP